jgi:hypothetical protein
MNDIDLILKEIATIIKNILKTVDDLKVRLDKLESFVDMDAEMRNANAEYAEDIDNQALAQGRESSVDIE